MVLLAVLAGLVAPPISAEGGLLPQQPEPSLAGVPSDPQTELMTVVTSRLEVDPTSVSPLGDDYDPSTGSVTFSTTDISLPGNFDIPVELRRWVPADDYDTGGPTGWTWNIPFIRGNYLGVKSGHSDAGWDWGLNTWHGGKNCSGSADVVVDNKGELVTPSAYWQGKLLHIPGATSETFLGAAGGQQVTKSNFKVVGCIDNTSGQQGMIVAGPDGLTYTFNQIKSYYNGKAALKDPVVYTRLLMVTKIQDRFGNHVDYTYTNGDLTKISASDGRTITIAYQTSGSLRRPVTATAHGRTWSYAYQSGGSGYLLRVVQPDGVSAWEYDNLSVVAFNPNGPGGYSQIYRLTAGQPVLVPGCTVAATQYTATVTSPSGLSSTYKFKDTIHYRSDVEPEIYSDLYTDGYAVSRALNCTISRSLTSRSIAGPGITTATWNYQYSTNRGTYTASSGLNAYLTGPFDLPVPATGGYPAPITSGTAVDYRSTTITGPDRKTVFYIDRKYRSISENRIIAQDVLDPSGAQLLQRTQSSYVMGAYVGTHWYMCPCDGYPPVNDRQLSYRINQTQAIEKQYAGSSANTFTTTFSNFDAYGFYLNSQGSNSFNSNVRNIVKTYRHDTANGLIGLPLTEKVNGTTTVEHHYNALGQRDWTKSFGKLQQTLAYNADGTPKTIKDGNNNVTKLASWKRGIPQTITFPATDDQPTPVTQKAVVNDSGWITSINDENNSKTCYDYDAMGRLTGITYPSEAAANTCNTSTWAKTTRSFARVTSAEYGIPAGHWKQTVSTGNGRQVTYFDALWRPLVTERYDNANASATRSVVVTRYDAAGRLAFQSYPMASLSSYAAATLKGSKTTYDALDRVTKVEQDSELGVLTATTAYQSGFKTKVTDPRGNATTTAFMAYDQPTQDWPVAITHPGGVYTDITRDPFGKPLSITRRNSAGTVSLTRSYTYNANQELCRQVEPETGATLMGYDGAGNLAWSAAGLAAGTACHATGNTSTILARRVDRSYDARNRLKTLVFPDGDGNQVWTYTPHNLPASIVTTLLSDTRIVTNQSTYNRRGLLKTETQKLTGWGTYTLTHTYNANGHLASLVYPANYLGPTVDYAPNALGQPTKAGTFASAVTYYPNGAIKSFTYGNGLKHTLTQNVRGLPDTSCDFASSCNASAVLNDGYDYDQNGNVAAISDGRSGNAGDRTMTYDALDRLTKTVSANMFGTATYTYDVLDNLTRVKVTGGNQVRDHYYCYDAKWQLANVKTGSCTGATVMGLGYDVQGNLSNRSGVIYKFDYGNRLREVVGKEKQYLYDGYGRRVTSNRLVNGSGVRRSIYSQEGQLLFVQDQGEAKRKDYFYLGGSLIAERSLPKTGEATPVAIRYQHTDALGSPVAITNESKTVVETTKYEPYGWAANRAPRNGPGYTGHHEDAATGMVYMQQRYYDPTIPRFLSVDPVTAYDDPVGQFHRYRYANNNPYRFTDPDGRIAFLIPVAIIAWRAYSAYDTVSSAAGNISTLTDSNAPGADKLTAGVELAGSLVGGKVGRTAAGGMAKMAKRVRDPSFKKQVWANNKAKNSNQAKCDTCGKDVQPGTKLERGDKVPDNRGEADHKTRLADGGADDAKTNGQLLCHECHVEKTRLENTRE